MIVTAAARPRTKPARYEGDVTVPLGVEETFAFFSDAHNLDRITPPWVGFKILTPAPIQMCEGTLIDYEIRLRGLPIRWRSEIRRWDPPHSFTDLQIKGPYRWWHHTHRFEPCAEGTRVIDEVEYLAPLHWLVGPLFVRRDVERIFAYRGEALRRELG